MRVVFMGSPEFALPTLRALASDFDVRGVVTMPDRPSGRGRQISPTPVKILATQLGISILQPPRLRDGEAVLQIRALNPDLIVVAAYGQILPPEVLTLPRLGCVNLHASLLPRYRGASPVSAALLAGEAVTGVTLMKMDVGLDTGPLLAQESLEISPEDNAGTLSDRLAELAGEVVHRHLPRYIRGEITPVDQDPSQASFAPRLRPEDARLSFRDSALSLERRIRAMTPWPGAHCLWDHRRLRIVKARSITSEPTSLVAEPGRVLATLSGPAVRTGAGDLLLLQVQLPGRKVTSGTDFLRGAHAFLGSRLE